MFLAGFTRPFAAFGSAVLRAWRARQRAIDLKILWPICCEQAPDLDSAKAAFAVHAFHDEAWLCLGEDEVYRIIDNLAAVTSTRLLKRGPSS